MCCVWGCERRASCAAVQQTCVLTCCVRGARHHELGVCQLTPRVFGCGRMAAASMASTQVAATRAILAAWRAAVVVGLPRAETHSATPSDISSYAVVGLPADAFWPTTTCSRRPTHPLPIRDTYCSGGVEGSAFETARCAGSAILRSQQGPAFRSERGSASRFLPSA